MVNIVIRQSLDYIYSSLGFHSCNLALITTILRLLQEADTEQYLDGMVFFVDRSNALSDIEEVHTTNGPQRQDKKKTLNLHDDVLKTTLSDAK